MLITFVPSSLKRCSFKHILSMRIIAYCELCVWFSEQEVLAVVCVFIHLPHIFILLVRANVALVNWIINIVCNHRLANTFTTHTFCGFVVFFSFSALLRRARKRWEKKNNRLTTQLDGKIMRFNWKIVCYIYQLSGCECVRCVCALSDEPMRA